MNTSLLAYRPPRIAMTLVLIAATTHFLTPLRTAHLYSSKTLGATVGVIGFTVMVWAWAQFKQRGVAICPTEETARLLTDGVYRLTRNPMYLGMTLMLAGLAAWMGSLPFYAAAAGFFGIIHPAFCPYEEEKLTTRLGSQYQAYTSRVRRWV